MIEKVIYSDDGSEMWIFAADQTWTTEDYARLRDKYNVYYTGDVNPVIVIPRRMTTPLFLIGTEDDGAIYFNFGDRNKKDVMWIDGLIRTLEMVKNDHVR